MASELLERQFSGGGSHRDQVVTGLERQLADDCSEPTAEAIADHRGTDDPWDGIPDAYRLGRFAAY